jgi:hypothetical protein
MNAYKVEVQMNEDAQLVLSDPPFLAGTIVRKTGMCSHDFVGYSHL